MRKAVIIMSTILALSLALTACGAPTQTDVMATPAASQDTELQMALDDANAKIADLTAQLEGYERGEREIYDAGTYYVEPEYTQALVNCPDGMRVWPTEGAVAVSCAINSEYAEVIAQCTALSYDEDGAPSTSEWLLIRVAVSSVPESELGWVPLECCTEYTEENAGSVMFPLKLGADYGQDESWFLSVAGTDEAGNVLVSAPGGWSDAVKPEDVVYPPVGGEWLQ